MARNAGILAQDSKYVNEAVQNIPTYLKKRVDLLVANGYRPDVDVTPELGLEDAAYYHSLVLSVWGQ